MAPSFYFNKLSSIRELHLSFLSSCLVNLALSYDNSPYVAKKNRRLIIIFNYDSLPYMNALPSRGSDIAASKNKHPHCKGPPYSNLITDKKTLWNIIVDRSMLTTYDRESRLILPLLLFIKEYLHKHFTNYAGMKLRNLTHY